MIPPGYFLALFSLLQILLTVWVARHARGAGRRQYPWFAIPLWGFALYHLPEVWFAFERFAYPYFSLWDGMGVWEVYKCMWGLGGLLLLANQLILNRWIFGKE